MLNIYIRIIIIIKNECHSNIIVDRLQGCGHSKKLRESESESHSSKVVWQARCKYISVVLLNVPIYMYFILWMYI